VHSAEQQSEQQAPVSSWAQHFLPPVHSPRVQVFASPESHAVAFGVAATQTSASSLLAQHPSPASLAEQVFAASDAQHSAFSAVSVEQQPTESTVCSALQQAAALAAIAGHPAVMESLVEQAVAAPPLHPAWGFDEHVLFGCTSPKTKNAKVSLNALMLSVKELPEQQPDDVVEVCDAVALPTAAVASDCESA
jgi:hypothetical protein